MNTKATSINNVSSEEQGQDLNNILSTWRQIFNENWLKPAGSEGLEVKICIDFNLLGVIEQVNIIKSSGSVIFDESACRAVWASSPLPLPKDENMQAFGDLKQLTLGFKNE